MRGFTLIETIIYIALLALIMGGTLMVVFNLLESSAKLNTSTTAQEEGNFVLRKLDWALSGASNVSADTSVACANTLHVSRYDLVEVYIKRDTTDNSIQISNDNVTFTPITTENVKATCLKFNVVTVGSITGITATTTLSGYDFATTKYRRK